MNCIIYVVAYNRPLHLKKTLNSLIYALNYRIYNIKFSTILIVDGILSEEHRENWSSVIEFGKEFQLKTIVREKNYGLRNNILKIIEEFHESEFDSMILLEDDILPSVNSLLYFDAVFNRFHDDVNAIQFSAFSPVNYRKDGLYKFSRLSTWMWGSLKNKLPMRSQFEINWTDFDLKSWLDMNKNELIYMTDVISILKGQKNGSINAWSLDLLIWMIDNKKLTIYPSINLVNNIGFDGSGTNCGNRNKLFMVRQNIEPRKIDWKKAELNTSSKKFYVDAKNYYSKNIIKRLIKIFI
jgi:hypothetical protein